MFFDNPHFNNQTTHLRVQVVSNNDFCYKRPVFILYRVSKLTRRYTGFYFEEKSHKVLWVNKIVKKTYTLQFFDFGSRLPLIDWYTLSILSLLEKSHLNVS